MVSWKAFSEKLISSCLIFLILASQTVQVSFFDEAEARPEDYRDIVSIFVDEETYDATETKIKRYASDIQGYLKSTRVSLHVVPSDIGPEKIASINEKLYYEGDGRGGSTTLVGTILIGNIPIPLVHSTTKTFPSLYPYVDFDDKYFLWEKEQKRYVISDDTPYAGDVDIWHGVINPSVGGKYSAADITKVSQFLDKTHDFYDKQGIFASSRYTEPPRVFYYDGFIEQKSLSYENIYAYGLFIENVENFVYNRFSKYLLTDLVDMLSTERILNQSQEERDLMETMGDDATDDIFPRDQIPELPDIQTKIIIQKLTKQFFEIVNSKTLGDIRHMVFNAGRYNDGANVRVDQPALHITSADRVSMLTIQAANKSLEDSIDAEVKAVARKIAIFDRKEITFPKGSKSEDGTIKYKKPVKKVYTNYFFGRKAGSITDPLQCTIARGSESDVGAKDGKGILVEANNAYDITTAESNAAILEADTTGLLSLHGGNIGYSCFGGDGSIKLDSYWGGNSVLRLANSDSSAAQGNILNTPADSLLKNFSLPIFSLAGMRETTRLPAASPVDCISTNSQYTLLDPYEYTYEGDPEYLDGPTTECTAAFPDEWNTGGRTGCDKSSEGRVPRYTCNTVHEVGSAPNLGTEYSTFASQTCTKGSIYVDGGAIASVDDTCEEPTNSGGSEFDGDKIDTTKYIDLFYKTIPSIVYHKSPNDEEFNTAEDVGTTPSLPIDMDRYVAFLSPAGAEAKIIYPNFFRMEADTVAEARAWLRTQSSSQWGVIRSADSSTNQSAADRAIAARLASGSIPASSKDWNSYISDEVLEKVIAAKKWLQPDIALKYKASIESSLSFSGNKLGQSPAPYVPDNLGGYEIAYLGLSPIDPGNVEGDEEMDNASTDITLGLSRIDSANMTEASPAETPNAGSHACGSPEGVDLFKWFPAIICWMKNLEVPKISAGMCSANTIGLSSEMSSLGMGNPVSPSASDVTSVENLKAFTEGSRLILSVERNSLYLKDSLVVKSYLIKNNSPIILPVPSEILFEVLDDSDGIVFTPEEGTFTDGTSSTVLSVDRATPTATRIQARLKYRLPDNSLLTFSSAPMDIRVSNESLDVSPAIDGVRVGYIDATYSGSIDLSIITRKGEDEIPSTGAYRMDVFDDISNQKILSDEIVKDRYRFPVSISKKAGLYRILVKDTEGRVGESTFAVRPGEASRINVSPASTVLVKGGTTPVAFQILDRLGNPTIGSLYETKISVSNGYIIDSEGKKSSESEYILGEGSLLLTLGSDTPGDLKINVSVSDPLISGEANIDVIPSAQVVVEREGIPIVGEKAVRARIRIVDPATNESLVNFSSPVAIAFPVDGGTFQYEIVPIENGETSLFLFTPGKKSGQHLLALDIPGMGKLQKTIFSVKAGVAMYIGLEKQETSIVATLLDRYGNTVTESTLGNYRYNNQKKSVVSFVNGVATIPRESGYLLVESPSIKGNSIKIQEDDGTLVTIPSVPSNVIYVPAKQTRYTFAPDYNALYTVLAGGSFLPEASDILYQNSRVSSSLAVTTLLDSPLFVDEVLTILPGGGYTTTESEDRILRPELVEKNNFPVIEWYDDAKNIQIAESVIHLSDPELSVCSIQNEDDTSCYEDLGNDAIIRLIANTASELVAEEEGGKLSLKDIGDNELFTINNRGISTISPLISVTPNTRDSSGFMVFDIESSGEIVGKLIIQTDMRSVVSTANPYAAISGNTLALNILGGNYTLQDIGVGSLSSEARGIRIALSEIDDMLDTEKLGPTHIDSLGLLRETPGVGWQANNTSLLSLAGGDTVGSATKWSHTFTMVNLGDPVAHVARDRVGTSQEGIDRSIGSALTSGTKGQIRQVIRRDMNNDGYEDLVIWYSTGYAELILNLGDRMRSRGYILHLADMSERPIDGGDFTGDKYGDMVYIDKQGKLIVLDNSSRRWTRKEIKVDGGLAPTSISQMKVFDMDADGKDDIVYLSEIGELAILYGTDTPGSFTKNILSSSLGVSLDSAPSTNGGALYFDELPDFPYGFSTQAEQASLDYNTTSPTLIRSQIYYQRQTGVPVNESTIDSISPSLGSNSAIDPSSLYTDITALAGTGIDVSSSAHSTYVKSEYAIGHSVEIAKTYRNTARNFLYAGDPIEVTITLKNTSSKTLTNTEYLDTLPDFLSSEKTRTYSISTKNEPQLLEYLTSDGYDVRMMVGEIAPGETVTLRYVLTALPAAFGDMRVGLLEGGEMGDDVYGDVGFDSTTTCGADILLWRSTEDRTYESGTRSFLKPEIPASIKPYITDTDGDGIPDYSENMTTAEQKRNYKSLQTSDDRKDLGPTITKNGSNVTIDIGMDPATQANIEDFVQDLASGLNCGFGGGSCMSFPINWAPLAPGTSPSVFGMPLSDLITGTGKPFFSGLTATPLYGPWGCFAMPTVYPTSPIGYDTACGTNALGAGGILGDKSNTNFIRLYLTPTLTLGMGAAACFGGPANIIGTNPTFPAVPTGNCVVIAKPMPFCKDDGSKEDGDIEPFTGLGSYTDSWNAKSCTIQQGGSDPLAEASLRADVLDYMRNPSGSKLPDLYTKMSKTPSNVLKGGPIVRIGGGSASGGATGIEIGIDSRKPFTLGNIVKIKNQKVSPFPEFIMEWVTRQVEEINNALSSPPNLFIVPPRALGQNAQIDSTWEAFTKKFSEAYSENNLKNFQAAVANAKGKNLTDQLKSKNAKSGLGQSTQGALNNFVNDNTSTINAVSGGANSMRAAYEFMGKLPFLRIERVSIPINVPWVLPRDLDKYERRIKSYETEIEETKKSWCLNATDKAACANSKGYLQANALVNSIRENIRIIESYKKFPDKLQKYLTWKQRYIAEILCNVDAIEKMIGGWLKDNGRRFRAWVEFYILLKAILKSWQPLLDIFDQYQASCSVCRNERYDLKYFQFKLISAVIPKLPILKFPRWPDIVLDLSDIRLGLAIRMPEFKLNISPIRLPDLPNLSLPNSPNVSISLPSLPKLPPLPELPDLPSLPSIPTITLPDLPSPPKLPKLFGSVSATLSILKLVSKLMCFYQKTTLVPENRVGNVIAERTERQSTLPIDFLNLDLPQVSLGFIKEIRVSTHVNFELKTDFITEMARASVKPINEFTTDFTRILPAKIAPDVNISTPSNINIKVPPPGSYTPVRETVDASVSPFDTILSRLRSDQNISLDMGEFNKYLTSELATISRTEFPLLYERLLTASKIEDHSSDKLIAAMLEYNTKKFSLFREYLDAEEKSLEPFQRVIKTLQDRESEELVFADALYTSDTADLVRTREDAFMAYQASDTTSHIRTTNVDLASPSTANIRDRLDRLTAAVTTGDSTESEYPDGYAPNFKGIYILTPSGVQTRLFDYTSSLTGDETVDIVDIDNDGDKDYIYMLDNRVYIKYSTLSSPTSILERTISTNYEDPLDIEDPSAPNYFRENMHESGYINLNFQGARLSDRFFRLEFYDRMLQWDEIQAGGNSILEPARAVIDLSVEQRERESTLGHPTVTSLPVQAYVERATTLTHSLRLISPKYTIHKAGEAFSLTPGRLLYTGKNDVDITYRIEEEEVSLTLKKYRSYNFEAGAEVRIESAEAYIFDTTGEMETTDMDIIRGFPIVPGVKIFTEDGDIVDITDRIDGITKKVQEGGDYYMVSLGIPQRSYTVRLPYQNGWYYGRLRTFGTSDNTRAGVTLLAPQKAADTNSPLIDLPDSLSIPVYTKKSIDLAESISESNDYDLSLDPNIEIDSNGNGIPDDDFATSTVDTSLSGSLSTFLELGPYTTINDRTIRLIATDQFGNTSTKDVTLSIYAPIPNISSVNQSGSILGMLDENIENEPIDVVRVREGSALTRFRQSTLTDEDGAFNLNITNTLTGIAISHTGNFIRLDASGFLRDIPIGYSIVVDGATMKSPMKISLLDLREREIYSSILAVPPAYTPREIGAITEATATGVFILATPPNLWVGALPSDPAFAGGGYITDTLGNALAAIHRDGNIFPLIDTVKLSYRRDDASMIITILQSGKTIADIIYRIDPFFTIR